MLCVIVGKSSRKFTKMDTESVFLNSSILIAVVFGGALLVLMYILKAIRLEKPQTAGETKSKIDFLTNIDVFTADSDVFIRESCSAKSTWFLRLFSESKTVHKFLRRSYFDQCVTRVINSTI